MTEAWVTQRGQARRRAPEDACLIRWCLRLDTLETNSELTQFTLLTRLKPLL